MNDRYVHERIGATAHEVCTACGKERTFYGTAELWKDRPVSFTLENALINARATAVTSGWGVFDDHWYCSTCWKDFRRSLERYDNRMARRMDTQ